jgi:hypothetical protein
VGLGVKARSPHGGVTGRAVGGGGTEIRPHKTHGPGDFGVLPPPEVEHICSLKKSSRG